MNLKKTIVLAAVLAAGALYLTKIEMPQREFEVGQRMAFSKLKEAEISGLDITRLDGDEQHYKLVRTPTKEAAITEAGRATISSDSWSIAGISGAVVDGQQLKGVIDGLSRLNVEGPLEEQGLDSDLSVYGLDKPVLTIVVHEAGDRSTEVAFGKRSEYLGKRYVKVSGRSGVFLVDDAAFGALNKSRSDIRSKTPFGFSTADVRELKLASFSATVRLQQPVVGEWKIVEPRELAASSEAVGDLLKTIQSMSVSDFIDGEGSRRDSYGFGKPRIKIFLTFRDGIEPKQVEYQLANKNAETGEPDDLYWLTSQSDTIFKLKDDPSARLVKNVDDLRERQIVRLSVAEIARVVSSGEGITPVDIATKGVAWTVNGKDSDPEFTEQLLKDIGGLQADEFPVVVPPNAFDRPFLVLSVSKASGDKGVITLSVGAETKGAKGDAMRFVRSSASDTVYLIRDVEAKRLVPHEEVLLPRVTPSPAPAN
jgi:hypothetical protein